MMRIDIITLFPDMCRSVLSESIIGRAVNKGAVEIVYHQLREYSSDKHRRVDDTPYGGGMGMVIKNEPIALCFEDICNQLGKKPYFIYMSPIGKVLTQDKIKTLSEKYENICILCGHYEGVDQRVIDLLVDEEISIGDYVVTGGELPAMVLTDAICRMLPEVLSNEECFTEESHYNGLLEYPQYTKPSVWRNMKVPEVLISGHHANIAKWRKLQSLKRTKTLRPDMFEKYELSKDEIKIISEKNKKD